jgi:hypothetical protein
MSHLMSVLDALAAAAPGPGSPIPGFHPEVPAPLKPLTSKILSWAAGLGLSGAVLGGLAGWGLSAVAETTERQELAIRSKKAIKYSLVGAGGIGLTASLVLMVYNTALQSAGGH